jgi:hypothetical protein
MYEQQQEWRKNEEHQKNENFDKEWQNNNKQ